MISIRPESISPTVAIPTAAPATNTLKTRILETTYLGDLAQHTIELSGGARAKMAVLNPGVVRTGLDLVRVAPEDIAMLPQ